MYGFTGPGTRARRSEDVACWTPLALATSLMLAGTGSARAQAPQPGLVESPSHPGGNFATDQSPKKLIARQMLEMTKALNTQYFPAYERKEGDSVLGRVTCFTCHHGDALPKVAVGE